MDMRHITKDVLKAYNADVFYRFKSGRTSGTGWRLCREDQWRYRCTSQNCFEALVKGACTSV